LASNSVHEQLIIYHLYPFETMVIFRSGHVSQIAYTFT